MPNTPDHLVFIDEETLTDGSKVYNIAFGNIEIPAITKQDAEDMAEKIMDAINEHSNDLAGTAR